MGGPAYGHILLHVTVLSPLLSQRLKESIIHVEVAPVAMIIALPPQGSDFSQSLPH